MTELLHVTIATDGACKGNPGIGGWGAVINYKDHILEINGAEDNTTNNRMELTAAIKALQKLKKTCVIDLFTDSKYLQQGITIWIIKWRQNNWKNSSNVKIKNIDLWQELQELTTIHSISWHWVKGHDGNASNEKADLLANLAIENFYKNL